MSWWRRIWCRHEHVTIVKTYAEPKSVQMPAMEGSGQLIMSVVCRFERMVSGCTDVVLRCPKCGDVTSYVLLGREGDEVDGSTAEALAARTTNLDERVRKLEAVKPIYGASGSVTGFASELGSAREPIDYTGHDASQPKPVANE